MRDRTLLGGLVLLAIGIIVSVILYFMILRSPTQPSGPIASVPIGGEADALNGEIDPNATLFEIEPAASEARFTLGELLRGEPTTVVGSTNQVAGQIAANFDDLATAQVGLMRINARTLFTDDNFRNNAIRNRILFTDEFEFITFTPTAINGLPESISVGEPVSFEIVGDLTIKDVTQTETFAVEATAVSPTQLSGSASATIQRADYDLFVPEVQSVANVDEAVLLEIEFVAYAVE